MEKCLIQIRLFINVLPDTREAEPTITNQLIGRMKKRKTYHVSIKSWSKSFILMVIAMVCAVSLEAQSKSFYDFTVRTIDGKEFPLSSLKGKKVLVVNVASKCGLTPQYAKLQELYEKYKDKNFVIIGFPANNFMGQEPGSNEEIAKFCSLNYDVTFPMMSKISVKGKDMAPLYQWLTEKKLNGKEDAPVQWNFQKFMIDENGNWIGFVTPKESPFSEKILTWIEKK